MFVALRSALGRMLSTSNINVLGEAAHFIMQVRCSLRSAVHTKLASSTVEYGV